MNHYPRNILAIFLSVAPLICNGFAFPTQNRLVAQDQRIAAPEDLDCPRDNLTVFIGRVAEYARNDRRLKVTIDTDWQTKETRTLNYADERTLLKRLRLNGKVFVESDWSEIESAESKLREGVRAKVWVCGRASEQRIVRIDWEPPHERS
jgi:hypothetical protein